MSAHWIRVQCFRLRGSACADGSSSQPPPVRRQVQTHNPSALRTEYTGARAAEDIEAVFDTIASVDPWHTCAARPICGSVR